VSCSLPVRLKIAVLLAGPVLFSAVQADDNAGNPPLSNYPAIVAPSEKAAVEALAGFGSYNAGYGSATSYLLRGMEVTSIGVLQAEVIRQSRFGYQGNYGDLSLTHTWSDDYYTMVSGGAGNSLLFPDWRLDLAGYRKFGDQRQYVAGLGTYYAKGNDPGRSDKGVVLNGIYYISDMVFEAGVRANIADPGSIFGPSEYLAATFGNDDRRAIILRVERARESYQVLTTGSEKVDFISHSFSVQWRERMSPDSLLILGLGYYKNPSYTRSSVDVGWRWSFR